MKVVQNKNSLGSVLCELQMVLEAITTLPQQALPVPGLETTGGAKLFVLVLPVSPNPTFLIMCRSWDLLIPHVPVLNEASCCLSPSNRDNKRTISHMCSELTSLLHCSCCWGLGTGPQGWTVHLMGLCEPEGLMMRKYYWEAICLNHQ